VAPHCRPSGLTIDDLRASLRACNKEELLELLESRLYDDATLQAELRVRLAATQVGDGFESLKAAIATAVDVPVSDYVGWQAAHSWYFGVAKVVEQLQRLYATGSSEGLLGVVEFTIKRIEDASGRVDDSGGEITMLLDELLPLHLRMVKCATIDPVALAGRLYELGKNSTLSLFHDAVERYSDVLGKPGLEEYHRLVRNDFERLPQLVSSDKRRTSTHERWFITSTMEGVARRSGTTEDVITVLKRDLSSPAAYRNIATELARDGQLARAIDWAQRGLANFRPPDQRLGDLLRTLRAHDAERATS
jgi:hypothetical protein